MAAISATQFSVTGDLTQAGDHHAGSCGGAGRDLAYFFEVAQLSDVSFVITSIGGNSPVGYLLSNQCTTESSCQVGTTQSTAVRLPAGRYTLIVDALTSSVVGAFTATVTLATPQPLVGDTCSSAEILTVTGGSASASGTTVGYASDYSPAACSASAGDRFYWLTLTSTANVSATVTPTSPSSRFMVALLGPTSVSSCSTAAEATCQTGSTGGASTLSRTGVAAGTYYLVVKGVTGDGAFSLSVTTSTTPAVVGDSCSTAVPLSLSGATQSFTGSVNGASNDRSASCVTSSSADVVYTFNATAGQVLQATVTPGSSWRPILTLSSGGTCSSSGEYSCSVATVAGGATSITSPALTAGTYYLWVDSVFGAGAGTFTLQASLSGAASPGDSCSAPTPLQFFSGSASASGTTVGANNDNTSSSFCSSLSGPDVVYSVTVAAGQTLSATVTPSAGLRPALILKGPSSSCSSAGEWDCMPASSTGFSATVTASALGAGTYYLWVDGLAGTSGTFTLNATLTGGSTSTGETCSTAIPITFSAGSTGTASVSGSTGSGASDYRSPTCGGDGPDRAYTFTLASPRFVTISVTPGVGLTPVLSLVGPTTTSSCSTAVELTCVGGNNTLGTISRSLSSGTYFLWVDGYSGSTGTFTLSLSSS